MACITLVPSLDRCRRNLKLLRFKKRTGTEPAFLAVRDDKERAGRLGRGREVEVLWVRELRQPTFGVERDRDYAPLPRRGQVRAPVLAAERDQKCPQHQEKSGCAAFRAEEVDFFHFWEGDIDALWIAKSSFVAK